MIDVSELMTDPDFSEDYQIERSEGYYDEGEWIDMPPTLLPTYGPIQPAPAGSALSLMPEGSRLVDGIVAYNEAPLYIDDTDAQRSDVIIWKGKTYRVVAQRDWSSSGYWKVWAEGFRR